MSKQPHISGLLHCVLARRVDQERSSTAQGSSLRRSGCDIQVLLDDGATKEARDCHGATSLSWASEHLRAGEILSLFAYGPHCVGESHRQRLRRDHGAGWGNGMDWNLLGEYLATTLRPAALTGTCRL